MAEAGVLVIFLYALAFFQRGSSRDNIDNSVCRNTVPSPVDLDKVKKLSLDLFTLIQNDQVRHDVPYFFPFIQWGKRKGLYSSYVKLNLIGNPVMKRVRSHFNVFDNNNFVTSWVTIALVEAFQYGGSSIPRISDQQLDMAISALEIYREKNFSSNTSVMNFWPQHLNSAKNCWESSPTNCLELLAWFELIPANLVNSLLRIVGLDDLADAVSFYLSHMPLLYDIAKPPADFDDTFVNLGLGSLLYQMKLEFPSAWKLWNKHNTNISSVFDALKKYAYRPFSEDPNSNSIDPRVYYVIRDFLDEANAAGNNVALGTSFAQTIDGQGSCSLFPFHVNDVDLGVLVNTVFGITSSLLSGLVSPSILEDPLVTQIYLNSTSLIAHMIHRNYSGRPDLALNYYPSITQFAWFVARTLAILETAIKAAPLPSPVLHEVYQSLKDAMESAMTTSLLSQIKHKDTGKMYVDDFLGNGDTNLFGEPMERAEDRIFTTAITANTLLYTWTVFDTQTGKTQWKHEVPETVKHSVQGCIAWLIENTLEGKYKPDNAFFSGNLKNYDGIPLFYPANRIERKDGTKITDLSQLPTDLYMYAMQGYVPKETYENMLKQKHFGETTPKDFHGYNRKDGYFPFWTSTTWTHSVVFLALSTYSSVSSC